MKGLDRITHTRLAEALVQSGAVSKEDIAEALASQHETGESLVSILVGMGLQTEWDLAHLAAEYFQLPFLQGDRYDIPKEALALVEEDFAFRHLILPLDRFGNVLTVAMPVLVGWEILDQIQTASGVEIFPVVGLPTDNKKKLFELYPDHPREEKRAAAPKGAPAPAGGQGKKNGGWESIFDMGDQAVKQDLKGRS